MKIYSRIIIGLFILTTSLWAMVATAQEKTTKPTTVNQPPISVLQTRKVATVTPTPTPKPRFKLPAKISVESRLPDVFQNQQQEYPRMPGLVGMEVRRAESLVRQIQPNARISIRDGQYTNNYGPGIVINHTPERGTALRPGAEVVLYRNPQPQRLPRMPNLVGQNIAEAEMRLFRLAPRIQPQRILSRRHDPNYGTDAVIGQSPEVGAELNSDARVVLYVNPQPPQPNYPKMPGLIGLDVTSAERKLLRVTRNFQARRIQARRYDPNYAPDVVVSQSPIENADLTPETQVILYLNPQPPPVLRMPNVVGMDAAAAEAQLQREVPNVSRRLETASRHDSNYRVGAVAAQFPVAGAELTRGMSIVLYTNPQPPVVRMPSLIGLDAEMAGSRLRQVAPNFQWKTVQAEAHVPSYPVNVVVSQSPIARTELRPGMDIVLSLNPQPLPRMPNLVGMSARAASSQLQSEAPNVPLRTERAGQHIANYAVGVVVAQLPVAGTELKPGSNVVLSLNPPPLPKMPNLVGMDPGAAGNRLRTDAPNIPWRMDQAASHNSGFAAGTVISQTPSPGTELRAGAQVVLTLNPQPPQQPDRVRVPDVRGLSFGQAKEVLVSLQLKITSAANLGGDFSGFTVTGQQPLPGEALPIDGIVTVTIVAPPPTSPSPPPPPPETTVVPDLKLKELAEINAILRAAQLELGNVTKKDSKETASFILEQLPAAGQRVPIGTTVSVVIGKPGEKPRYTWLEQLLKALAVVAFGFGTWLLARLWKRFRSNRVQSEPPPSILPPPDSEPVPPPVPVLGFRTTMNASSAEFATSTDFHTSFALQFQPRADWGQQYVTVNGALIAAESEEL